MSFYQYPTNPPPKKPGLPWWSWLIIILAAIVVLYGMVNAFVGGYNG